MSNITKKERDKFIDYVYNFYGPEGIYPIPTTKKEISEALTKLEKDSEESKKIKILNDGLSIKKQVIINIEYDSIDRERVRDIILERKRTN
jgi:hypothetical protein